MTLLLIIGSYRFDDVLPHLACLPSTANAALPYSLQRCSPHVPVKSLSRLGISKRIERRCTWRRRFRRFLRPQGATVAKAVAAQGWRAAQLGRMPAVRTVKKRPAGGETSGAKPMPAMLNAGAMIARSPSRGACQPRSIPCVAQVAAQRPHHPAAMAIRNLPG